MKRRFSRRYKSLLRSVERAKKLKDLEIAKSLEVKMKNNNLIIDEEKTPEERSDLPKE